MNFKQNIMRLINNGYTTNKDDVKLLPEQNLSLASPYLITITSILLLFVLVGCTTTPVQPGTTSQCPSCPVCSKETSGVSKPDQVFMYFINVGQGDAALLKSGEIEMLIDCGNNEHGQTVVNFLKQHNVAELEYLIMTHPDSDHIGGCDDVLQQFKVKNVITNGDDSGTLTYKDVLAELDIEAQKVANVGDTWEIGKAFVNIIQSNNHKVDTNENSLVLKVSYGSIDILMTSDCDNLCEANLLDNDIQAEILKVAHHGSKFATGISLLEKVQPRVAIISVGPNSYGHPARETLDRLAQENVLTYRTDSEDHITVELEATTYHVIT